MKNPKFLAASSLALVILAGSPAAHAVVPCAFSAPCYAPGFVGGKTLPGSGAASPWNGHPVIADLGLAGGRKSIVFVTFAGQLWVVNLDGTIATGFPITLPAQAEGGPAVADLDGDGRPDIVVAWGAPSIPTTPGGFGAWKNNGPGQPFTNMWMHSAGDKLPGPTGNGVPDGIVGTPAIGNVFNDGHNHVVIGGFDEHVYLVDGVTGQDKPGWPVWVGDTIWSSPALADLDGDGKLEIIIGTDAHFQAQQPPGVIVPPTANGGLLVVLSSSGALLPGFPRQFDQVIFSAPVVGDINGDGRPEIVFGTGTFYAGAAHRVYAVECDGTDAPGWPVAIDGQVTNAPALGDLNGDGKVDVVVTTDGSGSSGQFRVYAINGNGTIQWFTAPKEFNGINTSLGAPVIADVLGDSHLEVLFAENSEVVVLSNTGVELTDQNQGGHTGNFPSFLCTGTSTGVAVDVDNGSAVIVSYSGTPFPFFTSTALYAWNPKVAPAAPPWGMFHRDPASQGRAPNAGTCAPRATVATTLHPLTPCRVIDTRNLAGPLGGPALVALQRRDFAIAGVCGVPAAAVAISANLTIVSGALRGELVVFPPDVAQPNTSAISFRAFTTRANNALVYLSATTTTFSVFNNSGTSVDFILDVNGYFQ